MAEIGRRTLHRSFGVVDRRVAGNAGQFAGELRGVAVRIELFAQRLCAAHVDFVHPVQVLVNAIEAAERLEQHGRCLLAYAGHTLDVVNGVAGQREEIGDLLGPDTEDFRDLVVADLALAAGNGYGGDIAGLGARLAAKLPEFFDGYTPDASLLHGDLWGGNWGAVAGEPVMFDPAVYYGDRETDIAMTMVFGGFGRAFYEAYESSWPMAAGHEQRLRLYQLYHILNHLNLFGRSYLGRAIDLMKSLL